MSEPTRTRYSTVAIILHWTIAALILWNIYIGLQYDGLKVLHLFHLPPLRAFSALGLEFEAAKGLKAFTALQLHKSIGFTVLALTIVRILWRLVKKPPMAPITLTPLEKIASHAVHWGFYLIMIGLPVTGWIIVSATPISIPTLLFKTVPVPHLGFIHDLAMPLRKMIEGQAIGMHFRLVNLTFLLLALHIGAALKHQFLDRDEVVGRMIPFLRHRRRF